MRVDITQFLKATRPADASKVTPADLQPLLLFLLVRAEELQPILLEAKGGTFSSDKQAVLDGVQKELDEYRERLYIYLAYVNEKIGEGFGGDQEEAIGVVNPILRGRYSKSMQLPGPQLPICDPRHDLACYDSVPDLATLIIIRNELAEFTDFEQHQYEQLFRDLEANGRRALCGTSAACTLYVETKKALGGGDQPGGPTPWWKWMLYGAGGAAGFAVLVKLLK